MAKEIDALRDYKFEDAALVQLADTYASIATRDVADLTTYGITAATIAALETRRDDFSAFPQDTALLNAQEVATNTKNTQRDLTETSLRGVYVRAVNTYGDKDVLLGSFGPQQYSRMNDDEVVRQGRLVHLAATQQQAALAAQGVDAAFLLALAATIDALDQAIDAKNAAVRTRDNSTRDRVLLGNSLYGDILKISRVGKDYYYSRNEVKYNEYVLNDDPSTAGKVRTFTLDPEEEEQVAFEDIIGTEQFKLENLSPAGEKHITYYFEAAPDQPVPPLAQGVKPGQAITTTAEEIGWEALKPFLFAKSASGTTVLQGKVTRVD